MKKILNFLGLSAFVFCSSLLNATTVNFPTDQPVIQKIEDWENKKYNPNPEMQTLLTLKEINSKFWNLEAFYLKGWFGIPAPEEVSLIKVTPDIHRYFFGEAPDTSAFVSSSLGEHGTLTYGYDNILDLHLATLWHLYERELAVGDTFTIGSLYATGKYEILDINDENVYYSIGIDTGRRPVQGEGFWNRKNGMVGQFSVYWRDADYELNQREGRFNFSSFPQE